MEEKKVSHRHLYLNKLQICHCDVRRKGNTVMKMTRIMYNVKWDMEKRDSQVNVM